MCAGGPPAVMSRSGRRALPTERFGFSEGGGGVNVVYPVNDLVPPARK